MDGDWRETLVPGSLFGNLHIVKRLGSGGMGTVFLAENPKGVKCALKVLAPSNTSDDDRFEARFMNEAEFALKTRHPNLVEVWDAGRDSATGLYYHVMEYMPGGSLRELVADAKNGLPIERAVSIARDVAHALVHIERNGMVHRDIKPDNVLFAADGVAKLADFGISRFEQGDDIHATRAAAVLGTPAYMAPEQMIDSHGVDIRADIYSFGVMLYEILAGRRPNAGENAMNTLAKAIEGFSFADVRELRPDVPSALAELVSDMTLPNPDDRPRSAAFVLMRIVQLVDTSEDDAPGAAVQARLPWYRDRGVLYAATAMALALEALVLAIFFRAVRGG
jgi:serine/threonine-protein kinase